MPRKQNAMTPDALRQRICEHRKAEGLTITEAATRYGCKHVQWSLVESGKKPASLDVLLKMAKAIGLEVLITVA
jgi:transcriptional regulator with XRE-family HTH domain